MTLSVNDVLQRAGAAVLQLLNQPRSLEWQNARRVTPLLSWPHLCGLFQRGRIK